MEHALTINCRRVFPPSTDDVIPFSHLVQKERDILRRVLEIAVHGDNNIAFCEIEAGGESAALPKVAPQPDHMDIIVLPLNLCQKLERSVPAAVIDENQLVPFSQPTEN